ncbi:Abi family protein [Lactiplantibacillus plantarum]|uniref:Abi family protein n=1 Tax=Lactiplantibacillus plantarum TaxID=1590 RepID=UPI0008FB57EF
MIQSIKIFIVITNTFQEPKSLNFSENKHVAVPLWVAIQFLTFGQLNMMLHLLKTEDLNKVIEQMNVRDKFTNTEFLNCMDVFNNLRNTCAHGRC